MPSAGYDIGFSGSSSATSGNNLNSAFNVSGGGGTKPAVQLGTWLIVGVFLLLGLWIWRKS